MRRQREEGAGHLHGAALEARPGGAAWLMCSVGDMVLNEVTKKRDQMNETGCKRP